MPYKFINFGHEAPPWDDAITDTLNAEERDGWKVVNVHTYEDNGIVKVLLHREAI